jgi:hypothetical protein
VVTEPSGVLWRLILMRGVAAFRLVMAARTGPALPPQSGPSGRVRGLRGSPMSSKRRGFLMSRTSIKSALRSPPGRR